MQLFRPSVECGRNKGLVRRVIRRKFKIPVVANEAMMHNDISIYLDRGH